MVVSLVLAACGADAPLTIVRDDLADVPLRAATAEQVARFKLGDAQFDEVYTPADGLGPVFIRSQCSACHKAGARGPGFVVKMAWSGSESALALPYGHTERPRTIDGATPLLAPADGGILVTQRSSPGVFGRGYIEAIADSEIEAAAAAQALAGAVSGRINRVTYASDFNQDDVFHGYQLGQTQLIGRFGLKARIATLDDFAADALQGDMGMTSPLRPAELPNPDSRDDDLKPGVDLPLSVVNELADYVRLLEIPVRRINDPRAASLFVGAGCAACHVPSMKTRADYPIAALAGVDAAVYSDLLLHDMGPSFSDGLIDGDAQPAEWKTAPLIGLRHLSSYLHDGRARTIEEAILLHGSEGSEAHASVEAFRALMPADQQQLLNFISSL